MAVFRPRVLTEWTVPTEEILVLTVEPREPSDEESVKRGVLARLLETVRSTSGVRSAALASSVTYPAVEIEGAHEGSPKRTVQAGHRVVTPEYLATMSIPLRAGRFFTREDSLSGEQVAVISEATSRRFWGSRSPIGQFIVIDRVRRAIVGVAGDARRFLPDMPNAGEVLVPYLQTGEVQMELLVRPSGDPRAMLGALRAMVKALDPDQPVERIATLERVDAENSAGAWASRSSLAPSRAASAAQRGGHPWRGILRGLRAVARDRHSASPGAAARPRLCGRSSEITCSRPDWRSPSASGWALWGAEPFSSEWDCRGHWRGSGLSRPRDSRRGRSSWSRCGPATGRRGEQRQPNPCRAAKRNPLSPYLRRAK